MVNFKILLQLVFFYGFFYFIVYVVIGCNDDNSLKIMFKIFLHIFAPV